MSTLLESIPAYLNSDEQFSEEALYNASLAFLDSYGCILNAATDNQALKFSLPFEHKSTKGIQKRYASLNSHHVVTGSGNVDFRFHIRPLFCQSYFLYHPFYIEDMRYYLSRSHQYRHRA